MNEEKLNKEKKSEGMFLNANHLVFKLAKDLRRNMTHSEKLLWFHLKDGVEGLKFRRQHAISCYIADFYCHKLKLIIELDGSIHDKAEIKCYDEQREKDLTEWGYYIMRFRNEEINTNIKNVLLIIKQKVQHLHQQLHSDLQ